MILLPHSSPGAVPVGLPRLTGHSLLIDFSRSDTLDQSGSGNNLTRNGSAARLRDVGGRRSKGVTASAAEDGLRGSTTAIVPDTGFVTVWAWYYPVDFKQERIVAGRGQDASGNGWSLILSVQSNGGVNTSLVTANPSAAQFSAALPAGTVKLRQWNFIALCTQNQYGAEPSHITAYANRGKSSKVRTGLTGWSQLRTSTVGFFIDDGLSSGGTCGGNSGIGVVGVESNSSLTETQALDRLYEIERITAPYFLRAANEQIFVDTPTSSASTVTPADGVATTSTLTGSSTATSTPAAAAGVATTSALTGSSVAVATMSPAAGAATAGALAGSDAGTTVTATMSAAAGAATTSALAGTGIAISTPAAAAGAATASTLAGSSTAAATIAPAAGAATASTLVGETIGIVTATIVPADGVATTSAMSSAGSTGQQAPVGGFPPRRKRRDEYEFLDPFRWRDDVADEPAALQAAQKVVQRRAKTLKAWKADLEDSARLAADTQAAAASSTDMTARDVQRWIEEYDRLMHEYASRELVARLRREADRSQRITRQRRALEVLLLAA